MLTDEDKKYIVNELLQNISNISNREYQERVWISGEGPECDDFTETVCRIFDDLNIDVVLKEHAAFFITVEQYQILKQFRDAFREFADNNNWPQEFIDTPEWAEIMEKAKGVLKAFHYPERVE